MINLIQRVDTLHIEWLYVDHFIIADCRDLHHRECSFNKTEIRSASGDIIFNLFDCGSVGGSL